MQELKAIDSNAHYGTKDELAAALATPAAQDEVERAVSEAAYDAEVSMEARVLRMRGSAGREGCVMTSSRPMMPG